MFFIQLTRKTQAAYTHLFKNLDAKWKLRPATITTDFERAMRNALKKQYPDAKLISCWFHFTQAIFKRAKKISGFLKFLKSDDTAKKLFRKFSLLPLIREDTILMAFQSFKNESIKFGSRFSHFLKYFEDQWIIKEGAAAICKVTALTIYSNLTMDNSRKKIPTTGCFFKFI